MLRNNMDELAAYFSSKKKVSVRSRSNAILLHDMPESNIRNRNDTVKNALDICCNKLAVSEVYIISIYASDFGGIRRVSHAQYFYVSMSA